MADTIKIRNTTRNQLILGQTQGDDGKPQDVILGSTDDGVIAGDAAWDQSGSGRHTIGDHRGGSSCTSAVPKADGVGEQLARSDRV